MTTIYAGADWAEVVEIIGENVIFFKGIGLVALLGAIRATVAD